MLYVAGRTFLGVAPGPALAGSGRPAADHIGYVPSVETRQASIEVYHPPMAFPPNVKRPSTGKPSTSYFWAASTCWACPWTSSQ